MPSEIEAAEMCGYLEAQGIPASYDKGGIPGIGRVKLGPGFGPHQILVEASDLDAAKQALAALPDV